MQQEIMTTEEKARAYDKAIERANEYHCDGIKQCIIDTLEYIFPELAESEDEKIRKWLEETIESMSDNNIIFNDVRRIDVLHWIEKQGNQKWSEEDEIGSDATIELLEYFINYAPEFRKPTIRRSIDWLNSLKKRMEE